MLSFKFFHFPLQYQGLFGSLLRTRGEDTVPARVDGKITILSIVSLLDGQLMKNLVLLGRLCTMVIEW